MERTKQRSFWRGWSGRSRVFYRRRGRILILFCGGRHGGVDVHCSLRQAYCALFVIFVLLVLREFVVVPHIFSLDTYIQYSNTYWNVVG
jgi:hypothetical protein